MIMMVEYAALNLCVGERVFAGIAYLMLQSLRVARCGFKRCFSHTRRRIASYAVDGCVMFVRMYAWYSGIHTNQLRVNVTRLCHLFY